jgi:hypothetical protein
MFSGAAAGMAARLIREARPELAEQADWAYLGRQDSKIKGRVKNIPRQERLKTPFFWGEGKGGGFGWEKPNGASKVSGKTHAHEPFQDLRVSCEAGPGRAPRTPGKIAEK